MQLPIWQLTALVTKPLIQCIMSKSHQIQIRRHPSALITALAQLTGAMYINQNTEEAPACDDNCNTFKMMVIFCL